MPDIELIHERLAPINTAMPQVLNTAHDRAMQGMNAMGLPRNRYRALYANNFIGVARNTIPEALEDDSWAIAPARNTVQLTDRRTGLSVRLLKRFAIEGAVPPAGRNTARMQAWSQGTMLDVPVRAGGKKLEGIHLVLIWQEENETLSCAAYMPKDAGRFPKSAKAEMIMKIPVTLPAGEFEGLRFSTKEPQTTLTPVRNTVIEHAHINTQI